MQNSDKIMVPAMCAQAHCIAEATEIYYGFPCCHRCHEAVAGEIMARIARDITRADDEGWVYVVKPVGAYWVKVGYTSQLKRRLKDLRSDLGEIHLLSVESGGRRREAAIHHYLRDFRLPGLGERFIDSQTVRDYTDAAGIDPLAVAEIPGMRGKQVPGIMSYAA